MVIVHAWATSDDQCFHVILPVIALVVTGDEDDPESYTSFPEPIFVDSMDTGLIGPADKLLSGTNTSHRAAVCPWPPDEDESRLEALIEQVKSEALNRRRAG
jgi:hypothetical protein